MWNKRQRQQRRLNATVPDQRNPFQRDRDRILYSSAFRRLSGITQIVRVGESDVFHTRQQHTLKVAQVGRRLAENVVAKQAKLSRELGVEPEVVEAACLAHDLGHPPFGHIGEECLCKLVEKHHNPEGFEGNAQSFRILTKLAIRFEGHDGLDLTRATLAACLKYPWLREVSDESKKKKWGAYRSETEDFTFARSIFAHEQKTAEAELMDWADDIAYSVHDLEDLQRCDMLPWHWILSDNGIETLTTQAAKNWFDPPSDAKDRMVNAMTKLHSFLNYFEHIVSQPYRGTRTQRQRLRQMTSMLIGQYIDAAQLHTPDASGKVVKIDDSAADQVRLLKQITRHHLIAHPTLLAQQKGQARIITELFEDILEAAAEGSPDFLPARLSYLYAMMDGSPPRFAADCITSLTEGEAVALHARWRGLSSGSVLDPIVR